jgi:hypothetical protein
MSPYIEGKNLKEIVAGGPLKLEEALLYATPVARGQFPLQQQDYRLPHPSGRPWALFQ